MPASPISDPSCGQTCPCGPHCDDKTCFSESHQGTLKTWTFVIYRARGDTALVGMGAGRTRPQFCCNWG